MQNSKDGNHWITVIFITFIIDIDKNICIKVRDENTYKFPNFNGAAIHYIYSFIYPFPNFSGD